MLLLIAKIQTLCVRPLTSPTSFLTYIYRYCTSTYILTLVRMSLPRFGRCPLSPRKPVMGFLLLIAGIFTALNFQFFYLNIIPKEWLFLSTNRTDDGFDENYTREDLLTHQLADMQARMQFLATMYHARQEDVMHMQRFLQANNSDLENSISNISFEVQVMLENNNMTATKTAEGLNNLQLIRSSFMYRLLPHLLTDPCSLQPAFHMKTRRHYVDIVMGIPTAKRDMPSHLLLTLSHLIKGINYAEINNTLIIVFIGETDLKYVIQTAYEVETSFQKYVAMGLIEVLSPASSFYPDFNTLFTTLEDPESHFRVQAKQNLDAIYLMAYAQTRGKYYLMLQDDVIAERDYIQDIKEFTAAMTVKSPLWFFIDYCHVGGIGKLFRSADLMPFITFVQLFFRNMPMDWLLDSYLANRICTIEKDSTKCAKHKAEIRPTYNKQLFKPVDVSLKEKINIAVKLLDLLPTIHTHTNPSANIRCDLIETYVQHTIKKAYDGESFFWTSKPKKGDIISFLFKEPTVLESFKIQSGNIDHTDQKLHYTVIEVLPINRVGYVRVGIFDESGLAEGTVGQEYGPLDEIRLRVVKNQKNTKYWVVISEIELKVAETPKMAFPDLFLENI